MGYIVNPFFFYPEVYFVRRILVTWMMTLPMPRVHLVFCTCCAPLPPPRAPPHTFLPQYNLGYSVGIWTKQNSFVFQAKSCQTTIMGNMWVSVHVLTWSRSVAAVTSGARLFRPPPLPLPLPVWESCLPHRSRHVPRHPTHPPASQLLEQP